METMATREVPAPYNCRCPLSITPSERRDSLNLLKSSGGLQREKHQHQLWARRDFTMKRKFACCSPIRQPIFPAELEMPTIFGWLTRMSREQLTSTAYQLQSRQDCQLWSAAAPTTHISPLQPPLIRTPASGQTPPSHSPGRGFCLPIGHTCRCSQ